jgi:hypothetical protein
MTGDEVGVFELVGIEMLISRPNSPHMNRVAGR